jgi:CheY-like chemotaxis protein
MFRVLLVDDEDAIRRLLSIILERKGFTVHTATSARAAVALLDRESFDLIITDLRMETPLAGFEVVDVARHISPRPAIAILTAFPVPSCDWKAAGADALIVKGASPLELPAQMEKLVHLRTAEEAPGPEDMHCVSHQN